MGASGPVVALALDGAGLAGTERHVRGLIEGLPRAGWRPVLITSRLGPLVDAAASLGVPHHLCRRDSAFGYVRRLRGLLRELRPALLHAHSGRLACLAARLAGVPGVLETRHGIPERRRPLYQAVRPAARWEGWKCALSDLTLCVCRADADWLVEQGGLSPGRIRVVPNGIVLPGEGAPAFSQAERVTTARRSLGLPEQTRLVGMVGRLAPQKAPGRMLDLLGALPAIEVAGVYCGIGVLERSLREETAQRGLEPRVLWLGEQDDGPAVVAALDLLLLPSVWEGLPYVLLEALAAGTPVLATPVGGVSELLAARDLAASVLPWDVAAWARAARSFLEDPSRRADWSRAAARRVRDYSESQTIAAVDSIYRELEEA